MELKRFHAVQRIGTVDEHLSAERNSALLQYDHTENNLLYFGMHRAESNVVSTITHSFVDVHLHDGCTPCLQKTRCF